MVATSNGVQVFFSKDIDLGTKKYFSLVSLSLTRLEMADVGASTHDGFFDSSKSVGSTPWPRVDHDGGCKWSRHID